MYDYEATTTDDAERVYTRARDGGPSDYGNPKELVERTFPHESLRYGLLAGWARRGE